MENDELENNGNENDGSPERGHIGTDAEARKDVKNELERKLQFLDFADFRTRDGRRFGPYYRVAFRQNDRQRSIYLGRSQSLADRVANLLAELRRPTHQRRAVHQQEEEGAHEQNEQEQRHGKADAKRQRVDRPVGAASVPHQVNQRGSQRQQDAGQGNQDNDAHELGLTGRRIIPPAAVLRRKVIVAVLAGVAGVVLTTSLGNWQTRRGDEKAARQAQWTAAIEHEPNLEVRQGQAVRFVLEGGRVAGVEDQIGVRYGARAVVVTTGSRTFFGRSVACERTTGPNARPPPRNCGTRAEP